MGKESHVDGTSDVKNGQNVPNSTRSLKEISPEVNDTGSSTHRPDRYVPEPPSTPFPDPIPSAVRPLYIALYDYDARTEEDLSFVKGELLEVNPADLRNDWWRAWSRNNGGEGFIPSNYVAEMQTLDAEE